MSTLGLLLSTNIQIIALTCFRDRQCLLLTIAIPGINKVFKLCSQFKLITSTEYLLSINFDTFDLWTINGLRIQRSKFRLLHLTGTVIDNIEISNELSTLSFQLENNADPAIVIPLGRKIDLSSRYFRINNLNILASIEIKE